MVDCKSRINNYSDSIYQELIRLIGARTIRGVTIIGIIFDGDFGALDILFDSGIYRYSPFDIHDIGVAPKFEYVRDELIYHLGMHGVILDKDSLRYT